MTRTPLDLLTTELDPEGCAIVNHPDRIWVFGGKFSEKDDTPPQSRRESFWAQAFSVPYPVPFKWLAFLARPEDHPEWWAMSGYDDLLNFERDACHLAKATILFPESPGSFAELGALASDEALANRLIVVSTEDLMRHRSFLRLGPFRRVEIAGGLCWIGSKQANPKEINSSDFQTILEHADNVFSKTPKKATFDPSNLTHQFLLIADIVDLLGISEKTDIQKIASHFGHKVSIERLTQQLELLSFFDLTVKRPRGPRTHYCRSPKSTGPWVSYSNKKEVAKSFDRARIKLDIRSYTNPTSLEILGGIR